MSVGGRDRRTGSGARLVPVCVPARPCGAVLVLHGGAQRSRPVSAKQPSVLRMVPIARRIARAGRGRLAVYRLRNSARGWNPEHTPAADARWALAEIESQLGQRTRTCLVGHSLGGRAALFAADAPGVIGVVALAPWLHRDDRMTLAGRRVLIVHGTNDRVADPVVSAAMAHTITDAAEVTYLRVDGGGHAMLRHHRAFECAAARFTTTLLCA